MSGENKEASFLEMIVKGIVQNPEAVQITQEVDRQGVKLTLAVDPADMGKVIGSQGRMANSIRTILHAYGGQNDARVSVIIEEPEK